MASIIKVDTIQDQNGNNIINEAANTITIGASGDTISIPSNVGIGTSSPNTNLDISSSGDATINLKASGQVNGLQLSQLTSDGGSSISATNNNYLKFSTNATERMRIDSSGLVLIGKTADTFSADGTTFNQNGAVKMTRTVGAGGTVLDINRESSDGNLINLNRASSLIGVIGTLNNDLYIASSASGHTGLSFANINRIFATNNSGTPTDNVADLGASDTRFANLYLGGGLYVGGTGTANKLDDYEEGTWTPSLSGTSGTITCGTYGTLEYTKIGRKVFISGEIRVSAISSPSGDLILTGLPFAIASLSGLQERTSSTVWIKNFGSTLDTPLLAKFESGSQLNFTVITDGDGGNVNANNVEVGSEFVFGATYITD